MWKRLVDHWSGIAGTLDLLWHFIKFLLEWAEHIEFIHAHTKEKDWSDHMIDFVLSGPWWLPYVLIPVGFFLIYLDVRKHRKGHPPPPSALIETPRPPTNYTHSEEYKERTFELDLSRGRIFYASKIVRLIKVYMRLGVTSAHIPAASLKLDMVPDVHLVEGGENIERVTVTTKRGGGVELDVKLNPTMFYGIPEISSQYSTTSVVTATSTSAILKVEPGATRVAVAFTASEEYMSVKDAVIRARDDLHGADNLWPEMLARQINYSDNEDAQIEVGIKMLSIPLYGIAPLSTKIICIDDFDVGGGRITDGGTILRNGPNGSVMYSSLMCKAKDVSDAISLIRTKFAVKP
jgi:hypothetical protein